MKHLTISFLLLIGILLQSHAQLTVADDNNVGIGVTEPVSELSIGAAGSTYSTLYVENNTTTTSQRAAQFYKSANGGDYSFAVLGHISLSGGSKLMGGTFHSYSTTPLSSRRSYGVRGVAGNATDGYNYGVYGYLYGSNEGAAVFGATPGKLDCDTDGVWAGYFRGNVYVENVLTVDETQYTSDINLKKDIRLLSEEDSRQMDKLKTLEAIKYKLKNPADLNIVNPKEADTLKVDPRTIEYTEDKYTMDKIGFSAQEVQLVYPELVKENNDGYLSMNYVGLIPVIVEALKEQDEAINLQDEAILALDAANMLQDETILALDETNKLQDETILALDAANKLQDEAILALDETVQAQAAQIEVLMEEIEKLKNPETNK